MVMDPAPLRYVSNYIADFFSVFDHWLMLVIVSPFFPSSNITATVSSGSIINDLLCIVFPPYSFSFRAAFMFFRIENTIERTAIAKNTAEIGLVTNGR